MADIIEISKLALHDPVAMWLRAGEIELRSAHSS